MKKIKVCSRCVMNDSMDNTIYFDKDGYCNYCKNAFSQINTTTYFPNELGEQKLNELLNKIKDENKDKKYDCVMGISGGLDSAYLAYLGYKWGLRILAVHIDDGFDTEISKRNIKKLCDAANIELRVIKPDEEQFNDLTLSYLKAGVPNLAIPQDNILFAFLYDTVKKEKIKYFLSGGNFALECILQKDHHLFNSLDVVNIKAIHKHFGTKKINKLKFMSSLQKYIMDKRGIVIAPRPLNYINYNKEQAFKELKEFCDFEYYGNKHLENIFTAFVQLYWYPKKFGIDKRTSHLSSMIVSGQMTRDEALLELDKDIYDCAMMAEYIAYIKNKLKISDVEFDKILNSPTHEHIDYRYDRVTPFIRKILF